VWAAGGHRDPAARDISNPPPPVCSQAGGPGVPPARPTRLGNRIFLGRPPSRRIRRSANWARYKQPKDKTAIIIFRSARANGQNDQAVAVVERHAPACKCASPTPRRSAAGRPQALQVLDDTIDLPRRTERTVGQGRDPDQMPQRSARSLAGADDRTRQAGIYANPASLRHDQRAQ
jgi:hypothetical protein